MNPEQRERLFMASTSSRSMISKSSELSFRRMKEYAA